METWISKHSLNLYHLSMQGIMHFFQSVKIHSIFKMCLLAVLVMQPENSHCSSDRDYVLGNEDVIKIQVWGHEDLNRTFEVAQDGSFTFPLVGKIKASGHSVFELEAKLKKELENGYLVAPQLTVSVVEYKSQKVFIFGEVKRPGAYVLKGVTPVLEVIAMAGGLTEKAGRRLKIIRYIKSPSSQGSANSTHKKSDGRSSMIDLSEIANGDIGNTDWVSMGDTIHVEEIAQLFVIGEVKKPGRIEWEGEMTIHQAISLAGGPTKRASLRRTKVVRVVEGKEEILNLKMDDVVRPDDIVKVPESYF